MSIWLQEVNKIAKLSPVPPPLIIRQDEAGHPEDPTSTKPITWIRPASPTNLYDIHRETPMSPKRVPIISYTLPFMVKEMAQYLEGDSQPLREWTLAYALNNNLSDENSWDYLGKIHQENVLYPEEIQKVLMYLIEPYSQIPHLKGGYPPTEDYGKIQKMNIPIHPAAKSVNFYLPPTLSDSEKLHLLLTGVYWTRFYRLERNRLQFFLNKFNLIDLYLVSANPFDRYPARKILSYYSDQELYQKFGRLGNYYLPKTYQTKEQQLNNFVYLSIYRFGYFRVDVWERPVRLTFIHTSQNRRSETPYTLDQIISALKSGTLIMPILKLMIMIQSAWPGLNDQEVWKPFLYQAQSFRKKFEEESRHLRKNPHQLERSSRQDQPIFLNLISDSVEQVYSICLLCSQKRDQRDFGLCGHGVCMSCQSLLGVVKCPFCTEHFTSKNLSNSFVQTLNSPDMISKVDRQKLWDRVNLIQNLKRERLSKFDWSNQDYQMYIPL